MLCKRWPFVFVSGAKDFEDVPDLSYRTDYLAVGIVNNGGVERGEIDASGAFGIVPHCLADGRYGDVAALGNACPAMTGDVGGKRNGASGHTADDAKVAVYQVNGVQILPTLAIAGRRYYRQKVRRAGVLVSVDDVLHGLFPFDVKPLAGLFAAVGKHAVAEVGFLQVSHVDKRHTARVKTEHEQVTRKLQRMVKRKVEALYSADYLHCHGALDGLAYARIYVLERRAVAGQSLLHGAVVYCPEVAHVERRGVGHKALFTKPCLVFPYQFRTDFIETQVAAPDTEAHKAISRCRICFGKAFLADAFQVCGNSAYKPDDFPSVAVRRKKCVNYLRSCIFLT